MIHACNRHNTIPIHCQHISESLEHLPKHYWKLSITDNLRDEKQNRNFVDLHPNENFMQNHTRFETLFQASSHFEKLIKVRFAV
jgi:hypothetical protein